MPFLLARVRDIGLHALSWGLLRACSPARTHTLLLRVGAHLQPIETAEEASRMYRSAAGIGTCLSRSIAVAARMPTADVVIGVAPRKNAPLFAHAWVEVKGKAIDDAVVAGSVIARLRGPRSTSEESA